MLLTQDCCRVQLQYTVASTQYFSVFMVVGVLFCTARFDFWPWVPSEPTQRKVRLCRFWAACTGEKFINHSSVSHHVFLHFGGRLSKNFWLGPPSSNLSCSECNRGHAALESTPHVTSRMLKLDLLFRPGSIHPALSPARQ